MDGTTRTTIGGSFAVLALLLPVASITSLPHYPWFGSYGLPYLLLWIIGIGSSIAAAKLLSKRWFWLTGTLAAIFCTISIIMISGDFRP